MNTDVHMCMLVCFQGFGTRHLKERVKPPLDMRELVWYRQPGLGAGVRTGLGVFLLNINNFQNVKIKQDHSITIMVQENTSLPFGYVWT